MTLLIRPRDLSLAFDWHANNLSHCCWLPIIACWLICGICKTFECDSLGSASLYCHFLMDHWTILFSFMSFTQCLFNALNNWHFHFRLRSASFNGHHTPCFLVLASRVSQRLHDVISIIACISQIFERKQSIEFSSNVIIRRRGKYKKNIQLWTADLLVTEPMRWASYHAVTPLFVLALGDIYWS